MDRLHHRAQLHLVAQPHLSEAGVELRAQGGRVEIERAQQIDITGGARVDAEPLTQQERPLEYESLPLPRTPEPMQETFDGVKLQQLGERAPRPLGHVFQADLDGVSQACLHRALHCSASR